MTHIQFNCPHCNRSIAVAEGMAGKRGKCPGCSQVIVVPDDPVLEQSGFAIATPVSNLVAIASAGIAAFCLLLLLAVGSMYLLGGKNAVADGTPAVSSQPTESTEERPAETPAKAPAEKPTPSPGGVAQPQAASESSPELQPDLALGEEPIAEPEPSPPEPPVTSTAPVSATPPTVGDSQQAGNVKVTFVSCRVDFVDVKDISGESQSSNAQLVAKFKIENTSKNKRVIFRGWPERGLLNETVRARDEHDNLYKTVSFGFSAKLVGDDSGDTINPGETVRSIVVVEPPIDAANEITLTLDARQVDATGKLTWRIAREQWSAPKKSNTQDLIDAAAIREGTDILKELFARDDSLEFQDAILRLAESYKSKIDSDGAPLATKWLRLETEGKSASQLIAKFK